MPASPKTGAMPISPAACGRKRGRLFRDRCPCCVRSRRAWNAMSDSTTPWQSGAKRPGMTAAWRRWMPWRRRNSGAVAARRRSSWRATRKTRLRKPSRLRGSCAASACMWPPDTRRKRLTSPGSGCGVARPTAWPTPATASRRTTGKEAVRELLTAAIQSGLGTARQVSASAGAGQDRCTARHEVPMEDFVREMRRLERFADAAPGQREQFFDDRSSLAEKRGARRRGWKVN